eukprot:Blabericola_migrator_1__1280@NODE_1330_length_4785_cov_81_161933_g893_i0_p1_GENE_NODE_1330_length_4785_cov_81_161933_g893_i0NODE_1330_length_4785_cov_81_161933_g893_i0_p1_ORF_typecomplete_len602_score109_49Sugar_tr/PF00083_24/3_2e93MFS_1/PF07690_16/1_4e19MFS_1/PF07690_16/3_2e07_NODE_1330_length_4785_cov_81_161933_g893_i018633668
MSQSRRSPEQPVLPSDGTDQVARKSPQDEHEHAHEEVPLLLAHSVANHSDRNLVTMESGSPNVVSDVPLDAGTTPQAAITPAAPRAAPAQPNLVDWNKPMRSLICACLPYFQQLIMLACLGSFLFGFNLSLLNTSIDFIAWEFEWCDFTGSAEKAATCDAAKTFKAFTSTAVFIGAAIGSITGGSFLSYGRRGMMQIANAVFVLGIVSSCCSNSFTALLWSRLVVGYAVGLESVVVPAYLSEITPSAKRGFFGVFHQLFITIGILVGTLVGLPLPLTDAIPDGVGPGLSKISTFARVWWRFMLGVAIIPVILSAYLLGYVYTFETPHYYLESDHRGDAKALYQRLLGRDDVNEELEKANTEVQEGKRAREGGISLGVAWKSSELRKVIIIGCVLSAFQQLSGINVFIASSTSLFVQAGLTGYMPTVMTVVMCLINSVMTLPAVPLIESMGRRSLLLAGVIGMTIAVLPATIMLWVNETSDVTMWLCIAGCLAFIICFAVSYGPILWVYLFEIYPMEIRGSAAGLATAVNWVAGIVMVFVVNYLKNKYAYLIFEVMSLISCVVVGTCMLETKGRTLGDSPYITNKRDEVIKQQGELEALTNA